jgi:DNA repair exonuclease SbcCD ATPase subunit
MKILYLKLKNSAGIWAAMNKTSLELDFNDSDDNIIMLFGSNGSGKSTIISSLHPFVGSTNDVRKSFFIEGKEGYKEIHYKDDKDVYIIKHYVKKQTKSYITKISYKEYKKQLKSCTPSEITGGEELNENGGVRTFNDMVYHCLGVNEDYFKISRVGTNVTNFIDQSTAERKKYISTFLPDIEVYLQKYKIANEKFRALSKEIKYVADEIKKLDNIDTLKEYEENYEKELASATKKKDKYTAAISKARGKILAIDEDETLKNNDYENPYANEQLDISNRYDKMHPIVESYEETYGDQDINELISETEKEVAKLNNKLDSNTELLRKEKDTLDSLITDKKKKKSQIEGLDNDDIEDLKEILAERTEELDDIKSEIDALNLDGYDLSIDYYTYLGTIKGLIDYLSADKSKISMETQTICKNIFIDKKMSYDEFFETFNSLKNDISDLEDKKTELKEQISEYKFKIKQQSKLNERPESCQDDSCVFIQDLIQYKNADKEKEALEIRLEEVESTLQYKLEEKERFEEADKLIKTYKNYYNGFKDQIKEFSNISSSAKRYFKNFSSIMTLLLTKSSSTIQKIIDFNALSSYCTLNKNQEKLQNEVDRISDKIAANEKISSVYDDLNKELEDILKKIEKCDKLIDKYTSACGKVTIELQEAKKELDKLKDVKTAFANIDEIQQELAEVNENFDIAEKKIKDIMDLFFIIQDNKDKNDEVKDSILYYEEKLRATKLRIAKYEEFNSRKENLEAEYEKTSYIKEATNPTKGIPIYFIDDYLSRTQEITNELLNLSQNGKFAIKFDVNDKDFFIRVYKNNGDILNDIEDASQGEVSLTSVSLSLALMEQSMSKYNIVLYDEIDGALDYKNRRNFIDMIENQRKKFNGEQVFIISHNNEFDSYPLGLILLNDNNINTTDKEFMKNKNVIFTV